MGDIFEAEKRSEIMSHVAGKETTLEVLVRKFLFREGFRFRKNVRSLPGTPDIVLRRYRTVIFLHGCFWHAHQACPRSKLPTTRAEFWKRKISGNVERDRKNQETLKEQGWDVITIWQCELSSRFKREHRLALLVREIMAAPSANAGRATKRS